MTLFIHVNLYSYSNFFHSYFILFLSLFLVFYIVFFFLRRCAINMKEPEKMSQNIKQQLLEKENKRREELMAKEIEEMRECSFQPLIPNYPSQFQNISSTSMYTSTTNSNGNFLIPQSVIVKGLGRHLELKYLSLKQKEEELKRERDAFNVKNVEKYRRSEDNSTIVKVK